MSITVTETSTQSEDRSWLSSNFGTDEPRSIMLDISTFGAAHMTNGFIRSGCILGRIGSTVFYGPYADAAGDGRQTAVGVLFSSIQVPNLANLAIDCPAAMMEMGLIVEARLPYPSSLTTAVGGFIDAAGKTDLVNWFKFL